MKLRNVGTTVSIVAAVTTLGYFLGFAWMPEGNASPRVLHGLGCAVNDTNVSVEAPASTQAGAATTGAWGLLAYDAALVLQTDLGGYGAERYVKAQLPWAVRMRLTWDSESDLLAAYGTREDVCMLARVVEQRRVALSQASEAHSSPHR